MASVAVGLACMGMLGGGVPSFGTRRTHGNSDPPPPAPSRPAVAAMPPLSMCTAFVFGAERVHGACALVCGSVARGWVLALSYAACCCLGVCGNVGCPHEI